VTTKNTAALPRQHLEHLPAAYEPIRGELSRVLELMGRELASADRAIAPIMQHIAESRGGLIRPALVLLSGKCFGRIVPEHIRLGAIVEMVHTATLLHDDVIDEASVRRGRSSLNSLWGNDCAVLAGDYLLARAFGLSSDLQNVRMRRAISATALSMCNGELTQDLLRGKWDISEDAYCSIIKEKTAAFFSSCCALGAMASKASAGQVRSLAAYGLDVGMAFQHTDDILDIIGHPETIRKSNGSDLANGKVTLPFIRMLAVLDHSEREAVIVKLDSGKSTVADFASRLRRSGALKYAFAAAQKHITRAITHLRATDENAARAGLVEIAHAITSRIDQAALTD
jgi:octaprenyl-diphosphate synthase